MIEAWDTKMINQHLMPNSRSYNIRALRVLMRKALSSGKISADQYPFGKKDEAGKFCIGSSTKTTTAKRYLPTSFIQAVSNFQSENLIEMWAVKLWLFSFYCRGINFRDSFKNRFFKSKRIKWDEREMARK